MVFQEANLMVWMKIVIMIHVVSAAVCVIALGLGIMHGAARLVAKVRRDRLASYNDE